MENQDLYPVGLIAKTHGVKGGVVLRDEKELPLDLEKQTWVFLLFDGCPIPFPIEDIQPLNPSSAVLFFRDIGSSVKPEELPGHKVYIAQKKAKGSKRLPKTVKVEGYLVTDERQGDIGEVSSVLDFDMNPTLCIVKNKKEILIPFIEPIIRRIDHRQKIIHIKAPEGLIDLYR